MTKDLITISPDALLEEAAILMRDNKVSFLPVVDKKSRMVGIITESDIFDSFIELLGFREPGTRLTIEAVDEPGIMSNLTSIIGRHGANITRVAVYRGQPARAPLWLASVHTTPPKLKKHGGEWVYHPAQTPKL